MQCGEPRHGLAWTKAREGAKPVSPEYARNRRVPKDCIGTRCVQEEDFERGARTKIVSLKRTQVRFACYPRLTPWAIYLPPVPG
jgi:hypothetical protein